MTNREDFQKTRLIRKGRVMILYSPQILNSGEGNHHGVKNTPSDIQFIL
jgi:hypothetical protein